MSYIRESDDYISGDDYIIEDDYDYDDEYKWRWLLLPL